MRRQVSARLDDDTYLLLRALASLLGTSQADVLTQAIHHYARAQAPEDRKILRGLTKRGLVR